MENFDGKIAVITGGGTGMGRELTYQLAAEGCHCLLYTSPSPRDRTRSRMPSSA